MSTADYLGFVATFDASGSALRAELLPTLVPDMRLPPLEAGKVLLDDHGNVVLPGYGGGGWLAVTLDPDLHVLSTSRGPGAGVHAIAPSGRMYVEDVQQIAGTQVVTVVDPGAKTPWSWAPPAALEEEGELGNIFADGDEGAYAYAGMHLFFWLDAKGTQQRDLSVDLGLEAAISSAIGVPNLAICAPMIPYVARDDDGSIFLYGVACTNLRAAGQLYSFVSKVHR